MLRNRANQYVVFQAISVTDGSAVTSGSPTVYVSKDGGSRATGGGTTTHLGGGLWLYAPTQGETDADYIAFQFVLTGAIAQPINAYPDVFSARELMEAVLILGATVTPNFVGTHWAPSYFSVHFTPGYFGAARSASGVELTSAMQALAGGGVTVAPLQAGLGVSSVLTFGTTRRDVSVFQESAGSLVFAVTDGNGDPVDLSSSTMRLVVFEEDGTEVLSIEDASISVSGDDNNQVSVLLTTTHTGTVRDDQYALWDLTNNQVVATGRFVVRVTGKSAVA